MSNLKMRTLLLVLTCLSACGSQVVEFKLDADVGLDSGADAGPRDAAQSDATEDLDATQPDAAQDAEAGMMSDADLASAPVVISTEPASADTAAPPDDSVFATFSKPMDPATLNALTFTLAQGAVALEGVVTWHPQTNTAVFNPTLALVGNELHTATITTEARDTDGRPLAASYTWTFTAAVNPSRPTIAFTAPVDDAADVAANTRPSVTFRGDMDPATINNTTFTVRQDGTLVPGVVSYDAASSTATFSPSAALANNLLYTASVTTGATSTRGLALEAVYTWEFTTSAPPRVVSTLAADGATSVPPNDSLFATFSKPMDAATINALTFTVIRGATAVAGAVTWNALTNTAIFNPTAALAPNALHSATITTGATDTAGLPLATSYAWSFTTAAAAVPPRVAFTTPVDAATNVAVSIRPTVTFSGAMDAATINNTTFVVRQGVAPVPGVVTYAAATNTATFSPSSALGPNLVYTLTVTTAVRDASGAALAAEFQSDFTTTSRPRVLSTVPVNSASAVPPNNSVFAVFSKAMDPAAITNLTFTLQQGATPVLGVVSLNSATNTATFNPTAALGANTIYTATITTGARDTAGLAIATSYTWMFTTAAAPAAPTVVLTTPANTAVGVVATANVTATFSGPMDAATINPVSFVVRRGVTAVPGAVTYNAATRTATFNPTGPLVQGALHTATVTTAVRDVLGLPMAANRVWSFTTLAAPAPTVLRTTPLNNALSAPLTTRPTATFNVPMDATTITTLTFTLRQGLSPVLGTVGYNSLTNTATFTPTAPLGLDLSYTATITTGARNTGGSALASNYTWTFETDACGQLPVELGDAGDFLVLAGSTVTSTGPTSVTGNLGVSPGTAVTGFPPGIITGMTHAGTPTSALAIADLTTAYNDAAGRVLCPVSVAGNLGGMTLAPGLYKSTSSLAVSSGDLTLDAQGDSAAVFIFQMASTLTATAGRQVLLINGADAANVFWQVGTSATLGTTSVFHGTIMADQAITLGTGARLSGRALARIAAVGLDSNIIVAP